MVKPGDKTNVVRLDGMSLTIDDVINVARNGYSVELDGDAVRRVEASSAAVKHWENSDDVVYGITTGFGDLASVNISRKDRRLLQENLLKSHACGVGEPFPEDITRAMMRDSGKLAATTINGIEMIETIKASGAENGYFERWAGFQASVNSSSVKFALLNQYLVDFFLF